jgi:hypothetical protein
MSIDCRNVTNIILGFTIAVLGFLVLPGIVAPVVVTGVWSGVEKDYTYNTEGSCKVLTGIAFETTCQKCCNGGDNSDCNTCDYTCYGKYWIVSISNGNNVWFGNGTIPIKIASLDINSAYHDLNRHPNGSISGCWYESSNRVNVNWDESRNPAPYQIAMVVLWTVWGTCLLFPLIACLIAICIFNLIYWFGLEYSITWCTLKKKEPCANKSDYVTGL